MHNSPPERFRLVGEVVAGRGNATLQIQDLTRELEARLGEQMVAGTLNIILSQPVLLAQASAVRLSGGRRLLWPASINGSPVWIYRWPGAPLHAAEVVSPVYLRNALGLRDGSKVVVEISSEDVSVLPWATRLVWWLFWGGRGDWCYGRDAYYARARKWCARFGATQSDTMSVPGLSMDFASAIVKRMPVLRPLARGLKRVIGSRQAADSTYTFQRLPINASEHPDERSFRQIHNVLNYTKTSGTRYAAKQYEAGYHTIEVNGRKLRGQRDPGRRLAQVPVDFRGKTVLDIGCNQGGMLLELERSARWGVGLDVDPRMINAANRLKSLRPGNNLHFYVFDLDNDPLDLIEDLLPEAKVDVIFLLAVCAWIKQWREVIDLAARLSDCLVFETTGSDEQQLAEQGYLNATYDKVTLLAETSDDDPGQKRRKLFVCTKPRLRGG